MLLALFFCFSSIVGTGRGRFCVSERMRRISSILGGRISSILGGPPKSGDKPRALLLSTGLALFAWVVAFLVPCFRETGPVAVVVVGGVAVLACMLTGDCRSEREEADVSRDKQESSSVRRQGVQDQLCWLNRKLSINGNREPHQYRALLKESDTSKAMFSNRLMFHKTTKREQCKRRGHLELACWSSYHDRRPTVPA